MQNEIDNTIQVLKKGGIILYPTDTVWGIGCDATNKNAVDRIYKLKRRSESKSMIILVNGIDMLKEHVNNVPEIAWDLIQMLQKPTTIIYPEAKHIAKNLIGEDGSVAIRIVRDEFCNKLITEFGKPIISTSANISGEPAPLLFSKISEEIHQSVDYVVNLYHNVMKEVKPSTILKLHTDGEYEIIRQ